MNTRNQTSIRTIAFAALCAALPAAGGHLAAQLIPKIERREAPKAPELTGLWTGEAREQASSGEVRFPVELRFTGTPERLALQVTGRGKVDAGQGQMLSFEVRASYRGALRENTLRMTSEKVETRIVEYDEVMPGEPQTLMAELADGVLRGRVGSDEEGWTSFTARAATSQGGEGGTERPAAPAGFAGTWQGDVQEPGPDGRPIRYVMKATVREAGQGLSMQLASDLQYPVGQGQTVPVEFRAEFASRGKTGRVEFESRSVKYKIVPENRTEDGGSQRVTAEVVDGVLTMTLYSDGNEPTRMQLRRIDGGGTGGGMERRDGGFEESTEEVLIDGDEQDDSGDWRSASRDEPNARNAGASAYGTLVLEPLQIRDRGLGNVHSHTLMVPEGWNFEGGVQWSMNPDNFAQFTGALRGPSGEELTFGRSVTLKWSTFNGQPANDPVQFPDDMVLHPLPNGYGQIAAEILLPRMRPGARDIEIVSAERLPQVEEQCREFYGDTLKMLEQSVAQMRSNAAGMQTEADMMLVAERARIRYRENGRTWEEEIHSTSLAQMYAMRSDMVMTESSFCIVTGVRAARAEAGQLDARLDTLASIAGTLRETPAWSSAIAQMRLEIAQARARGRQAAFQQAQAAAARTASSSDISDMQMESWRRRQDSQDRMQKATVDSIHETQDFRHSDGSTWTFTNSYDRAFMNAGGQVVLTNDPSLNPGADPRFGGVNWQQMERVDPFRR